MHTELNVPETASNNKSDWACRSHFVCRCYCERQYNFKKPDWFAGWVDGSPELYEKCEYFIKRAGGVQERIF